MPTLLDAIEHTKRGRLQEAEAIYLQLLAAQPDNADALHYLGVLRMGQRRRDEAIELVTKSLKVAPRNAHAWNSLGNMVAATGKLGAAEFAFKSALELQPDFLEAHYNLGNLQRRMRKREEALQSFQRVVELNPKLSVAHENIAMLLFRLKRTAEATAAFQRWCEADPENPIARHMLAAYTNQAPERADDAYDEQDVTDRVDVEAGRRDVDREGQDGADCNQDQADSYTHNNLRWLDVRFNGRIRQSVTGARRLEAKLARVGIGDAVAPESTPAGAEDEARPPAAARRRRRGDGPRPEQASTGALRQSVGSGGQGQAVDGSSLRRQRSGTSTLRPDA